MNFVRTSNVLLLLGVLCNVFGRSLSPGADVSLVSGAIILLAFLFALLSVFGLGRPAGVSPPWITLALGGALLVVVVIAAVAEMKKPKPAAGPILTDAIEDAEHRFRLKWPGEGWAMIPRDQMQAQHKLAFAGARRGDAVQGMILVERLEKPISLNGPEGKAIGQRSIDNMLLQEKRVVWFRDTDFLGKKTIQYQIVGTTKEGLSLRYENTLLAENGFIYQVVVWARSDKTDEAGTDFQPFRQAFELLPPKEGSQPQDHPPAKP